MSWILVDANATPPRQVVQAGGSAKSWNSLPRAIIDVWPEMGRAGQAIGMSAIEHVGASSTEFSREVNSGCGCAVRAIPVMGPDEGLSGILLTVEKEAGAAPMRPPAAAGFNFDADRLLIRLSPELIGRVDSIASVGNERISITLPEFFSYVDVPDALGIIEAFLDFNESTRWEGAAFATVNGAVVNLHISMSRTAPHYNWQGLIHEIAHSRSVIPTLDAAALNAVSVLPQRSSLCLIELQKVRLLKWFNQPPAGIQWKGVVDDRDTPHPEDVDRIFSEIRSIVSERRPRGSVRNVRLRRASDRWTHVDCTAVVIQREGRATLALVEMIIVGES